VIGATARGASHVRQDLPCQDAVGWWQGPTMLVAACADGAGSAPRSEEGAQEAVRAVLERVRGVAEQGAAQAQDAEAIARLSMRAARAAVRRLASEEKSRARAFATTLALCVLTPDRLCVAQIGDGIVCIRTQEGLVAPFPAPRRTYANEAVFITAGRRLPRAILMTYQIGEVNGFCLSSDGLRLVITQNALTGEPFEPFFADLFGFASRGGSSSGLASFLQTVDDRTDDDKSLVVGVRLTEGVAG
jgi:hypothetical protein